MPQLTVQPISEPFREYDAVLCAVGFERRARNAIEKLRLSGRRRLAIGFPDRQVFSYADNRKWFVENGFTYLELNDVELEREVRNEVFAIGDDDDELRIAIDISSFNRVRLALLVQWAAERRSDQRSVTLHLFYSLATFTKPSTEASSAGNSSRRTCDTCVRGLVR